MNEISTRKYLGRAYWAAKNIRTKYERIEELRATAEKCTTSLTGMPHGGGNQDKLADIVATIVDMQNALSDEVQAELALLKEIEIAIKAVRSDKHREVLEQRYLAYRDWGEIAASLGYELRWVYRIHEEALHMIHF